MSYGFGYDLGSCPGVPQNYGISGNYGYNGGVNNYASQPNYEGSFTASGNIAPYKRAESSDSSGAQFATFMGATAAIGGAMVLASKKHKKTDKTEPIEKKYNPVDVNEHEYEPIHKNYDYNDIHENENENVTKDENYKKQEIEENVQNENVSENTEKAESEVQEATAKETAVEEAVQEKAAIANQEEAAATAAAKQKVELKPLSEIINPNLQITIPEHIAEKPVVQNAVTPNLPAVKAKTDIVPTGTKAVAAPKTQSVAKRLAEVAEDIPYIEAEEVLGTGGLILPQSRRIEQKPETGLTRTRTQRPRLTNIVDAEYEEIPLNRLEAKTPNLPVRTKGDLKPITEYLEKAPKEYKLPVKAPKLLEVLSDVAKHFKI
jgi:hypothetical protein